MRLLYDPGFLLSGSAKVERPGEQAPITIGNELSSEGHSSFPPTWTTTRGPGLLTHPGTRHLWGQAPPFGLCHLRTGRLMAAARTQPLPEEIRQRASQPGYPGDLQPTTEMLMLFLISCHHLHPRQLHPFHNHATAQFTSPLIYVISSDPYHIPSW